MTFDRTYEIDGTRYRIIIHEDVIAAPYQGWSDCGYLGASSATYTPPPAGWFRTRLTGGRPIPACGLSGADIENLILAIHAAFSERMKESLSPAHSLT